jgi:hypothetical protein
MKTIPTLPVLLAIIAFGATSQARASELRMTVEKPHFTCEGRGRLLSQAAFRPGQDRQPTDAPLPCCDGQIGCAQFLSTSTIVNPDRPQRG